MVRHLAVVVTQRCIGGSLIQIIFNTDCSVAVAQQLPTCAPFPAVTHDGPALKNLVRVGWDDDSEIHPEAAYFSVIVKLTAVLDPYPKVVRLALRVYLDQAIE